MCPSTDINNEIGSVMPEVSSNIFLFLYLQGLQLLEVVVGKNQNWLIRGKPLLPSSELVHQASKSNCCLVHGAVIIICIFFSYLFPRC